MNNLRMYLAAATVALAVVFTSASFIYAKPKGENRTPQQKCDDAYDTCRIACNPLPAEKLGKCLADCDSSYLNCRRAAATRTPPIKGTMSPPPIVGNAQKSTSTATPTPKASTTPKTSGKQKTSSQEKP